ncbi:MAG: thioesterase [Eubacterium sp.]|nr:thioesterase [Eubacterium sp.]
MGKIYQKQQKINGYECAWNYKLQPTAAMNYFQQSSQEQSEALGVGPEVLDEMGLAWFLVKYQLKFHRYPRFNTTVTVETEAMSFDKFAAHRRFALLDEQGEVMIEGDTEWMLLNRRENRLERLSNVPEMDVYGSGHENKFKLRRLTSVKDWQTEKVFQVRYQDIDFNSHVNHVNYLAWAVETLPLDKVKTEVIDTAKIIYKNQGFYGDVITVKMAQIGENAYRMDIVNQEDTLLCQIELTMKQEDGHED